MTRRVLASAALAGAALATLAPAVPANAQCPIRGCIVRLPCFATPDTTICLTVSP